MDNVPVGQPVGGIDYPRTWSEFHAWFPDDLACLRYLVRLRWPLGFVCPRCDSVGGWLSNRGHFICTGCRKQTSPTAGTIFHKTRTPLPTWFAAMWYVTSQKSGVSALGLSRVLGVHYETAWTWMHKLRRAMVRPDRDRLSGTVEVDETYVGGPEEGHPGRQVVDKSIVAIAVEMNSKGLGRVRLRRISDVAGPTLVRFVKDMAAVGTTIHTDGWPSYAGLSLAGFSHQATVLRTSADLSYVAMPAVHRVASLLKRWLLGTHQGAVSPTHLDFYLDEFTFRFNRRSSRARGLLFYRLLQQSVRTDPYPLKELVGGITAGH